MRFNVAELLRSQTGATREVEIDAPIALDDPAVAVSGPVEGHLRLTRDDSGVWVSGEVGTMIEVACARCLADVAVELTVELSESFRPTVTVPGGPPADTDPESEAATLIDSQHVLDLTEVVRQALLLAVPLHPLCRAACAGLCPGCGIDLNTGSCDCEPEPDPRWDALRALLDEAER